MTEKFSKLYIALKFRLKGMGYYRALHALELAKKIHDGLRKDGVTPEFQHQVEIALYILTLKDVKDLEGTLITALLHDTPEDEPHRLAKELDFKTLDNEYGCSVARSIAMLNKHSSVTSDIYFEVLSTDLRASLVKGVDRINNFQSMNRGKFTLEKQVKYSDEVTFRFLPMLKTARKNFPEQMDAYYNIENMLKSQHELIQLFIEASR